ncbi:hypothetical protein ACHAPG_006936 [Botrytis cinerea]
MTFFDINTTGDDVLKHFSKYADGKIFVITGPSENGIGAESAITLASENPKKIILVGRTKSKSVRQAAEKIKTLTDKINILINNAGVMAVKHYATSVEGVESQFAANYLGHFLLTNLLAKEIVAAASEGARIVQVGSLGYQLGETHIEDINFKDGETYNPWIAYGQTKTAMLLFNLALDKRLNQKGITALICHPGEAAPAFIVENEIYTETKEYALNEETAEGLWKLSEKLVGETFVY